MGKKDFFSGHSKLYATFRPTYPDALYEFIFQHIHNFDIAWDCATGNGQVARHLSKYFKKVYATDISQPQLDNAYISENIIYSLNPAEQTNFNEHQFDIITVGQAIHWFHVQNFYAEVRRVAKQNALLTVWDYNLCSVNPWVNEYVTDFYRNTVWQYWDSARRIVEEEYKNIPFPFEEIPSPKFSIEVQWTANEFAGYLTTWSATQKFIREKGFDPVPSVMEKITPHWKKALTVTFPVFLKLGRVN